MIAPYYQDAAVTIYHGDCREILPLVRADVVVTDPPYNVGYAYASHDDRMEESDYLAWLADRFALAQCDTLVWFWQGSRVARGEVPHVLPPRFYVHRCAAWFKREFAGDSWHGAGPAHCWEPIVWATRLEEPAYFGGKGGHATRDCLVEGNSPRHDGYGGPGGHPCPKPESVVRQVLAWVAGEGHAVLDPFAGSGTTLRAAKDLGRKAIGIDIEERYCEIAARRCAQEVMEFGRAGTPEGGTPQ